MIRSPIALSMLLAGAMVLGSYSSPSLSEDAVDEEALAGDHPDFKNLMDRFSYAYGADLAEKFKLEGIELNVDLMAEAMQAAFDGDEMKMSSDEALATIDVYRGVHMKKKEAERAIEAEKNQKEGDLFLAENAKKDGVIVTDSGLQYRIISEGSGDYRPTADDEVKVHYRGKFVDGTEFDSTYDRNEPLKRKPRQLIDGWAEALQMMSEGAKWELYIDRKSGV